MDCLIEVVNPRKLIYFAVDGVAPRAKINQQRSRRFRTGKEIIQSMKVNQTVAKEMLNKGMKVPDELISACRWDSNVITPGTDFMQKVSQFLENYIINLLSNNSKFKHLKVMFSDASVPKEGEHKILEFIRLQRVQTGYNPNLKHCIFGADADLIMLGLSTHEPHFYILRERIIPQNGPQMHQANQMIQKQTNGGIVQEVVTRKKMYLEMCYVKLYVVREFLSRYFRDVKIRFEWDLERFIDEFTLLCFFVGNDFLPHIPGLSIRKGGVDILLSVYKNILPTLDGYITKNGKINLERLEKFLYNIGQAEQPLLHHLQANDLEYSRRMEANEWDKLKRQDMENQAIIKTLNLIKDDKIPELAKRSHAEMVDPEELDSVKIETLFKQKIYMTNKEKDLKRDLYKPDTFALNKKDYKRFYYEDKFKVKGSEYQNFREAIKLYYIEGIIWNYEYYYKGCVSWDWFYPYYYAPLLSDLTNFHKEDFNFKRGEPFSPCEQLLSVLPPFSKHALPICLQPLVDSDESEIIDLYPKDFDVDLVGKKVSWLGEVILPFVEKDRIQKAIKKKEPEMTQNEKDKNKELYTMIFMNKKYKEEAMEEETVGLVPKDVIPQTKDLYFKEDPNEVFKIDEEKSNSSLCRIFGRVKKRTEGENEEVEAYYYSNPSYKPHYCKLLRKAKPPKKEITQMVNLI